MEKNQRLNRSPRLDFQFFYPTLCKAIHVASFRGKLKEMVSDPSRRTRLCVYRHFLALHRVFGLDCKPIMILRKLRLVCMTNSHAFIVTTLRRLDGFCILPTPDRPSLGLSVVIFPHAAEPLAPYECALLRCMVDSRSTNLAANFFSSSFIAAKIRSRSLPYFAAWALLTLRISSTIGSSFID